MKRDLRYICYTYMREKSCKVDYEVKDYQMPLG